MTQKRVWPDFLFTHAPPNAAHARLPVACCLWPVAYLFVSFVVEVLLLFLTFNYQLTQQPHCMRRFSPKVVISRNVPPLLRREIRRDLAFSSRSSSVLILRKSVANCSAFLRVLRG